MANKAIILQDVMLSPFFGWSMAVLGHLKRVHVPVEVLLPKKKQLTPVKNGPCYDLDGKSGSI